MVQVYRVYKYKPNESKVVLIATVVGSAVVGDEAVPVERILREGGWPKVNPIQIINGSYVWTEKAQGYD